GFKSANYKHPGGIHKANWTNVFVGVRGTYHLTLLKDKNNKFDPYGGVTLGMRFLSHKDSNPLTNPAYNRAYPIGGLFVGARYKFTPNFGVFAEAGYDVSFLRAGLAFSF